MEQGNDEQVANAAMAQARAEVAQMSLESLLKAGGKICWNVGNPMPSTSTNLLFGMVDTIHKHGNIVMIYLGWFIGTYWYHFDDHMTLIFHIKIDAP